MNYYRHYSFDLWLTLIRSDPSFKIERTRYFFENLNFNNKPIEEVAAIFRQVDIIANAINECTCKNIDADELYLMVIGMVNDFKIDLKEIDLIGLMQEMDRLMFRHIPHIYSTDTIPVLDKLKQKEGVTMNILSNTGFIKGSSLRRVLAELGLSPYFDFQVYSDEAGLSKPSGDLFRSVISKAIEIQPGLEMEHIVHVGDNPNADIRGAIDAGINAILVNANGRTLLNI